MNRDELADKLEYHEEAGNGQVAQNIGGECIERSDVMLIYSRPEFEMGLNFASRIRTDEANIEKLIDDTCAWFQLRHVTPEFRVSPLTQPANVAQIFERRGFVCNEHETQMVLDGKDTEPPTNPRVSVEIVSSNDLEKFVTIQHHAFGGTGDPSSISIKMAHASFASGMSTPYIARIDGDMVSAGALIFWAGVFGIYGVATSAKARGQGVGTALVRRMIQDARARGDAPICLQAETGANTQRWYERMGFRVVYDRTGWSFNKA
jgi:ribosomal protein S18 acetylase RimI-like enzyme